MRKVLGDSPRRVPVGPANRQHEYPDWLPVGTHRHRHTWRARSSVGSATTRRWWGAMKELSAINRRLLHRRELGVSAAPASGRRRSRAWRTSGSSSRGCAAPPADASAVASWRRWTSHPASRVSCSRGCWPLRLRGRRSPGGADGRAGVRRNGVNAMTVWRAAQRLGEAAARYTQAAPTRRIVAAGPAVAAHAPAPVVVAADSCMLGMQVRPTRRRRPTADAVAAARRRWALP